MRKILLPVIISLTLAASMAQVSRGPISRAFQYLLAVDGTVSLPAYSFASEPTLGFYRNASGSIAVAISSAARVTFTGSGINNIQDAGLYTFGSAADLVLSRGAAGRLNINNTASAIGSSIKVDALPTVASGFGTSPSITAGSTPFAGSVNVGTGGAATTGVINFNGTAYPSAPFCVATPSLTNVPTRATTVSTTQLTLTTSTAWTASDVVSYICVSSK